jgi:uncharacterized membrane protein
MIFAGFNVFASKVASVLLGLIMLLTLYWAKNWVARVSTVLFIGLIVALWFIQEAVGLRYFVLFMG